ncbi:hypothetical protein LTS17_002496 [Exophiala oligosperma]
MPVFETPADVPDVRVPEGSESDRSDNKFVRKLQEVPRAMAYYDDAPRFQLPSPHHLGLWRLARRASLQNRPRYNSSSSSSRNYFPDTDQNVRSKVSKTTTTRSKDLVSSIYSKVRRRQSLIRRNHSLYSLPEGEESEDSGSENDTPKEKENDIVDIGRAHVSSDNQIFVHTEITISESLELDLLSTDASHQLPRLTTTYISGPKIGGVDTIPSDPNLCRATPESSLAGPYTFLMESRSRQSNDAGVIGSSSSSFFVFFFFFSTIVFNFTVILATFKTLYRYSTTSRRRDWSCGSSLCRERQRLGDQTLVDRITTTTTFVLLVVPSCSSHCDDKLLLIRESE